MSVGQGTTAPRIGVIGLGTIGRMHIAAWNANELKPVAFADASPVALEATLAEHGGQGFATGEDLIASGLVDIVSICTPPVAHCSLTVAAAAAGVAVLCEKPMAWNMDDAETMVKAVEQSGILFSVGFCHRFQLEVERIRELIDDGAIGDVMSFRNRFAGHKANAENTWFANPRISSGGVLADTSIHSIDIFRYLIGDPIRVAAVTGTRATTLGPKLEVDDTAAMILQTADGVIGVIESSWRTPAGEWSLTVSGTDGTLIYDYASGVLTQTSAERETHVLEVPKASRFDREFAHFVACWRGEAEPRVTVRDGYEANRILAEAYRSAGDLG